MTCSSPRREGRHERRFNLAPQLPTPEAFGRFVLSTLRPQPENFRRMKKDNLGWE